MMPSVIGKFAESLVRTFKQTDVVCKPQNLSRFFSSKNVPDVTKPARVFQYYTGPGGMRRRDGQGNIDVFNTKTKKWIQTDNPVHLRAIDFDSTAIKEEEAFLFERILNLKKQ